MDKKKIAFKVYDKFRNHRSLVTQDILSKQEEKGSDYYGAGNGFPPASKEKEYYDHLRKKSEEEGDTGFLFPTTKKDKVKDAFNARIETRRQVLNLLTTDAQVHAPEGGVTIKGKFFKGGEFIPLQGGYQEAYKKQLEKNPEEKKKEGLAGKPEIAPDEPKKEEGKPKYQLKMGKPRTTRYKQTPEQIAKQEVKGKKAVAWKEHMLKTIVGVPGKELNDEILRCNKQRLDAEKYWKEMFGVDINDGTKTQDGGYSPSDVVDQIVENKEFMSLPVDKRIQLISSMQRKNLPNVYSEEGIVKQNQKQEAALIYGGDTVRGCLNNCVSCYACMLAGGVTQTRFDVPVPTNLKGKFVLNKSDLESKKQEYENNVKKWEGNKTAFRTVRKSDENPEGKIYYYDEAVENLNHVNAQLKEMGSLGVDHTFLRIGVAGDPATDWKHTNEVIKKGLKGNPPESVVFVSKLQRIDGFDPKVVRNMHVSVDPFNSEHMNRTMENVLKLKKLDPSLNVVLRIRSFDSKNKDLMNNLQKAVEFANDNDLPVLETKMRFTSSVAKALEMNLSSYHKTDGVNIKANHNFLGKDGFDYTTKKPYTSEDNPLKVNKHLECDRKLLGCQACGNCVRTATQKYPWNQK